MSLQVPQAKTRHLSGDKNKLDDVRERSPVDSGLDNLCGAVLCVRAAIVRAFPKSRRTESYTVDRLIVNPGRAAASARVLERTWLGDVAAGRRQSGSASKHEARYQGHFPMLGNMGKFSYGRAFSNPLLSSVVCLLFN